jgi:hypothetical protein
MTKFKKKYFWSWAIAGAVGPLIFLLVGLFMPKPPEWHPFQEPPTISRTQQVFADIAILLWPTGFVAEFLSLAVTDAGGDAGTALPSTIIFLVSLLLNVGIYLGFGFILWFFGEVFSSFFRRRSPD